MNNFNNVYSIEQDIDAFPRILRYYFVSKGHTDIVKAIEYQYVGDFDCYQLYNLAFGNYDLETGFISDEDICNNSDHYKVLHTVLNTVPLLFDSYKNVMLVVQGSDSKPDFIAKCKTICTRKCREGPCKMAHRRINIYRNFVDKNFEQLSEEYLFLGGNEIDNQQLTEPYVNGRKYGSVLVRKKP